MSLKLYLDSNPFSKCCVPYICLTWYISILFDRKNILPTSEQVHKTVWITLKTRFIGLWNWKKLKMKQQIWNLSPIGCNFGLNSNVLLYSLNVTHSQDFYTTASYGGIICRVGSKKIKSNWWHTPEQPFPLPPIKYDAIRSAGILTLSCWRYVIVNLIFCKIFSLIFLLFWNMTYFTGLYKNVILL